MSCKESPHAGVSTTTISSVAVQAGNSKIVIALVKCGEWVQLQLTESQPNLLEIGSSQDETKKLLHDHELLLAKLKALEDRVWELLQEADRTAEANKAQSQVYDAMAQTLGEAWATLVSMLEKRRELLGLTSEFFESALEFAIKIDQTEAFLQNPHEFESTEALQSLLQLHDRHAKELLERSLVLLNKSQQLTDFIEKFKCDGSDVNAELIQGAQSSCLKIDSLLELLQDRRRQLDKYLQQQRQELAQVLQLCLWDQQENQVTCWFQKTIRDLQEQSLGSSLSNNKELIRKHKDLEVRAKEWNSTVEKLKNQALEIVLSKDFTDKEHLQLSNQKLNRLQEEFGRLMVDRKSRLTLANDFFNSANKAFDVLGEVEAYLKLLKSENLSLPVLAARHEELHREIKDSAAAALQKGQTLISQADSCSSQVTGIQEMMGCIQKHVDRLGEQCTAHKEYALKKQQLAASVEGTLRKVEMSIQEIRPVLSNTLAVGSSPSESEKILNKYLELDIQAKETAHTLEAAAEIMAEKNELELDEGALLSFKAKCLEEELSTLGRSISYRSRVLQTYVAFRKSSEEVEEQLQTLKAFYLTKVPPTGEDDAEVKYWSNSAERRWQLFLKKSFVTQDLGLEFLNLVNLAKENEIFNAKDEMCVMRNTMEKQTTGREELSRLRMAWYLRASGSKPVRQQWETFKEKLKKTTHNVKLLHEVLMPVSALDLGGSLQTMSDLRRRWNAMKPQLQQLYDEVQYIIKEWEVLSGQGAPLKEKADQLKDLIHLHERQRARIRDYEEILYKTIQFHQVKEELMHFIKSKELELLAQPAELEGSKEVQMQLDCSQERRAHVEHLGQLALSLGVDIISSVQQPNCSNISAKSLQQQLEVLELDSREWSAGAKEYERVLSCILEFCTTREEINELKESFKDIKKKFNNLKFNYSKKNEKSRNLKTLQYQIQQVDMYAEKIQALRKKMEKVNNKTSDSFLSYPSNKVNILLEAMEDLKKHVDDFDKVMTDYKVNLDMTEHLQEIVEECNFWYEDASATVVRVGKYSMECQTKEAVEILHTQFNKFIAPSVPQQEERIQEVTDLAQRLYGLEEGQKYAEKTVTRHKEILESITELCGSLVELKEKLEQGDVPKQGDLPKMNPNLEVFHDNCIDLLKEPPRNEQTLFSEERNEGQMRGADTLGMNGTLEHGLPMDSRQSLPDKEDSAQGLILLEDMLSGEESECISSDDISLPPLPMSPESPLAPSDMEVEELASSSAPMLHIGGYRTHTGTGVLGESQESVLPPPIAFSDGCRNKKDTFTTHFERPYPQFKAESSLTSKGSVEMSTKLHINVKCPTSMPHEVHTRALQQGSQARESSLETQEKVHADSNVTKTQDRLHDPLAASPGLRSQSDTSRRQAGPQGDRKHSSAENSVVSLAGQAPHFSRLLSNVTVTEGSPVTLEVEVTGFPEPTLTWFKKGQQLCADGHLQVLHKDTKHSVFIPKVCEADAGLYVAQAQNSSGTLSSKAILHVTGNHESPITRINWIVLCAIYVSVSLIYWLLAQ